MREKTNKELQGYSISDASENYAMIMAVVKKSNWKYVINEKARQLLIKYCLYTHDFTYCLINVFHKMMGTVQQRAFY